MPSVNLSDIKQAADAKFGDFEITLPSGEIVRFQPALRLPKAKRQELAGAMNLEERAKIANGDDLYDVYKDIFRITARTPDGFSRLDATVGDDPAVWEELANEYLGGTQAGEASPSAS
jgi:hypothetical protein